MMNFEELGETTREWMLAEFQNEESNGNPYRSKDMTQTGLEQFPKLMENAIKNGNEETLAQDLANPSYWNPTNTYMRNGKMHSRSIDPETHTKMVALSEFNTWYVHGLARRLI